MSQPWIAFCDVSFTYETATQPLLSHLTLHFPAGWTGIVGANGVGKTTILRLATGALAPIDGRVTIPGRAVYCPQRTDDAPAGLDDMLKASDGDACALKGRLGIEDDWLARWDTLSHGERKRAQIGVALWRRPDVLALDEPTNHIDVDARDLLVSVLRGYGGAGLLVSHDRELLDTLCGQCVFVESSSVATRPGGYTQGAGEAEREEEQRRRERKTAKQAFGALKREASRRRGMASRAHSLRSKGGINPKDHDAKAKIGLARITGKDGQAGRLLNQLSGRVRQAEERLREARVKKAYDLGIWLPEARSRRDYVLRVPEGEIPLGPDKRLRFPELALLPDSRVAVTGPNGAGKSTLVAHIMGRLNVPRDKVIHLPQEVDLPTSQQVLREVRTRSGDELGHVMAVVSRLNSRPDRLLDSEAPSPGEIRKLLLALGIARGPHLIAMDEPTNHLDLPSIVCLEKALADCPCAMLLVSHDRRFLGALTRERWAITPDAEGAAVRVRR